MVSHVALQFWNIRSDGTLYNWNVTDQQTRDLVDYLKTTDIKIGMAIVNIGSDENDYDGFDWTLVRPTAYGEHQAKFITNILNIADSLGMDDVNLDLEGENQQGGPWTQADRDGYADFVSKLADSLHARGKTLTAAAYGTNKYGAPNPSWYGDWVGKIDQVHTMNYTGAYWSATGISGYRAMHDYADSIGYNEDQLLIGMPVWVNNWSGGDDNTGISNIDNLYFLKNCLPRKQGITLWDITQIGRTHQATGDTLWTQDSVWSLLHDIATDAPVDDSNCPSLDYPDWLIDNFSSAGTNLAGGLVAANSDFWNRDQATRADSGTQVFNLEKTHDMVAGNGSWGDISVGYRPVDQTGINNIFDFIVHTRAQSGTNAAEGGVIINFLPTNPTQDPSANAWEYHKIGVNRDLSWGQELVVGAKCDAGAEIVITVNSKAEANDYSYGGWGQRYTCSGDWEDFRLPWEGIQPFWGTATREFDPSQLLRMMIITLSDQHPSDTHIALAGVAMDSSVIEYRQADIDAYLPNVTASLKQARAQSWDIQSYFTPNTWTLQALPSHLIGEQATLKILDLKGRLVDQQKFTVGFHNQGVFHRALDQKQYLFQLEVYGQAISSQKIQIIIS